MLACVCGIPSLQAQLTVSSTSPFSQYVADIQGPGVVISNINMNCDTVGSPFGGGQPQMGGFNATATTWGLTTGLLMTSGSISSAPLTGGGGANNVNSPGDAQLNALLGPGNNTNDACIVTFDVVPACDSLTIKFRFASNEYPEFVLGGFNDAFAAFIQGPGFPTATNMARIPTSTTTSFVTSVLNVNATTNNIYYVDNNVVPVITAFDAFTVIIESKIAVIPCQTYSIKLVIADEQDGSVDSGVFVESMSCGQDPPAVIAGNVNNPNSPEAVEGCIDGYFILYAPGGGGGLPINFNVFGTATPGVDYTVNLVPPVIIPPGQDSLLIPVTIFNDNIVEGDETIIVALDVLSCFSDTAILTIKDPFQADAGPNQTVCSGQQVTLGGPADTTLTYSWVPSIGFQGPQGSANPTASFVTNIPQSINYVLNATDQNGCIDKDTVNITFVPLPQANFAIPAQTCINEPVTITFLAPQVLGANYTWNFGTNIGSLVGSNQGPYQVSWTQPGTQTVTLQVADGGCISPVVTKTIIVNNTPTANFTVTPQVCAGQAAQITYTGSAGIAGTTFLWDLDGGGGAGGANFTASWNTPGIKNISLTVIEN
ncbi:MAG: hypothetical protein EAZ89_10020, partial [Bacteroidetes bacterium]